VRRIACLLLLLVVSALAGAEDLGRVTGRVFDSSGAAIREAQVELRCGSSSRTTTTSGTGEFAFGDVNRGPCSVTVSAAGFAGQTIAAANPLTITLAPLSAEGSVTVTASRTTLASSDLPVTADVETDERLAREPALTVDDKLRQVPGFSLYRRSGSETANPTTQGVSLRGLGASGASRSLVLEDGVPLNDPFGGWIYWGRVPLEDISQIDVVEGGVSDLYGSNALGGVINVRTRDQLQTAFMGEASYGTLNTPLGSFVASASKGKWGATFAGESLYTDGYIPVPQSYRGPVDTYADSEHQSGDLLLERQSKGSRVFLRGQLYGESRQNGTQLQVNQATVRQLETGGDWNGSFGAVSLRVFGGTENLHQTFSAINAARTVETLSVNQRVPVTQYGASAQWSKVIGHHMLAAGVDERNVTGETNELHYVSGEYSSFLIAGGRQQTAGVFGEDLWQVTTHWLLSASLRFDDWVNQDASSRTFPVVGNATVTPFPDRSETALSPRVGVTRIITDRVSIYGSGYRSFRAPTLNELYRSFRVGNVVTNANQDLVAEHFAGGELGVRLQATGRVAIRATGFGGMLESPVGNITLSSTPTLITRQRQNIGGIAVKGIELATDARVSKTVSFTAGYQFVDATVSSNPKDPTLIGKSEPLVPRHAVTFAGTYSDPRVLTVSIQGRSNSTEYDDDQNTLPLDPYFNLGAYVSRQLKPGFVVFAASENLLDQSYTIARTPVPSVAEPRTVRIGVRIAIGEVRGK
jgi:outer membrane receptor protein involved in Fe transport